MRLGRELIIASASLKEKELRPVPAEILRNHCLAALDGEEKPRELVEKAVAVLNGAPGYNCLRFEELANTLIEQRAALLASRQISYTSTATVAEEMILDQVYERVLEQMKSKIEDSYISKKRISPEKAEWYSEALGDYLYDLLERGETGSKDSYLRSSGPGENHDGIDKTDHNRFAYLVKDLETILAKEAKKFLESNSL